VTLHPRDATARGPFTNGPYDFKRVLLICAAKHHAPNRESARGAIEATAKAATTKLLSRVSVKKVKARVRANVAP